MFGIYDSGILISMCNSLLLQLPLVLLRPAVLSQFVRASGYKVSNPSAAIWPCCSLPKNFQRHEFRDRVQPIEIRSQVRKFTQCRKPFCEQSVSIPFPMESRNRHNTTMRASNSSTKLIKLRSPNRSAIHDQSITSGISIPFS